MSRESLIFVLGFIVLATPFLGIPRNVKDILIIIVGAFVMFLGFLLRRAAFMRSIENGFGERHDETFAEPIVTETEKKTVSESEDKENIL